MLAAIKHDGYILMKKKNHKHGPHSKQEVVELSEDEYSELITRLESNDLNAADHQLLLKCLRFMSWLQTSLMHTKITISKLQKLFSIMPAKRSSRAKHRRDKKPKTDAADNNNDDEPGGVGLNNHVDVSGASTKGDAKAKRRNGRVCTNDYTNKEIIDVAHESLSVGDDCPEQCGGRLYAVMPGSIIRIKGQSESRVLHYQVEKLRCALCQKLFSDELPHSAGTSKYDARFKAQVAVRKYYLGVPYYCAERYQQLLGMPLSDSTQWNLAEEVADCTYPILNCLEKLMVQGELVYFNDTKARILSWTQFLKDNPDHKRRGCFTTAIIGEYQHHPITLYRTSLKHAGENMDDLLNHRNKSEPPIKAMSDALNANTPKQHKVVQINCLAHGIRKFIDIAHYFENECEIAIDALCKVFELDEQTRSMSNEARLKFHQQHSRPIMDKLKAWLHQQLDEHFVEENSHLGKAIAYLINHWSELTAFLRIPGAPLENNKAERALKLPIRNRKTAMFNKTEHGAAVAAQLQSLIQTCVDNNINPIDYLVACQVHKSCVFKEPQRWLPWNYHENINLQATAA